MILLLQETDAPFDDAQESRHLCYADLKFHKAWSQPAHQRTG
ncbi:hypothetical protein CKS_4824 [Pantoea stewartii subsp. stewartii DC283]|uniref:Uncharacterized protein n=1 Tax=Pantoea stewartii subsp. stewartii DC283 TaxID=660596 RepID=H3RJJ2_PANSE|nr:hypothetical protein CKS_4824 [Pantoea stewartii subsp. stewartii DC283]